MEKEIFEEAKLEIGLFDASDILTKSNVIEEEEEIGIPDL